METDKKKFYPGPIITAAVWAVRGILIGALLNILYEFLVIFRFMDVIYLQWPLSIITGLAVSAVVTFVLFTYVVVDSEAVEIRKIGRKKILNISDFDFHTYSLTKENSEMKALIIKVFLYVKNDEVNKAFRLRSFSQKSADKIVNEINILKAEATEFEQKARIQKESFMGEKFVSVPKQLIKKAEKKRIILIIEIYTVLLAFFLFTIYTDNGTMRAYLALAVMGFMLFIWIPHYIFKFRKNTERCPEEIYFVDNHLIVGEENFNIDEIETLLIISAECRSSSIFPVQRYIKIKSAGSKYIFWLGTESSMNDNDYQKIIRLLKEAFINSPDKLKIIGTFLN